MTSGAGPKGRPARSTRDRILDIALDLFIEKGYDGTSLREIAERLGFTKAALYYHFASKDDILMALHMRIHEVGREGLEKLADTPIDLTLWESLLNSVLDQVLAQRKLFLMHERNQAAMEKLHRQGHDAEHEDIQQRFTQIMADSAIPLRDRVKMASSFGAVFAVVFLGDAFGDANDEELGTLVRDSVHSILAP